MKEHHEKYAVWLHNTSNFQCYEAISFCRNCSTKHISYKERIQTDYIHKYTVESAGKIWKLTS